MQNEVLNLLYQEEENVKRKPIKKISVTCIYDNKTYSYEYTVDREVPEYLVADDAFRSACLFAQTQAIAESGRPAKGILNLEKLDYNYTIEEIKE